MANTLLLAITVIAVFACHTTLGMDCFGSDSNLIEKLFSCPRPLYGNKADSYCCWSRQSTLPECCNLGEYVVNFVSVQYTAYFIGGLIGASIVILWFGCCRR